MMVSSGLKGVGKSKSDTPKDSRIRKRYPCTCPCCKDGLKLIVDGKQKHLCHYADCGRVFVKKSHLTAHLRTHSGEKPYICNFKLCHKRFTRSDELSRHKKIHSGDRFHKCSLCPKSFIRADHLAKHTRVHDNAQKKETTIKKVKSIKSEPESDASEENDTLIMEEEYLEEF